MRTLIRKKIREKGWRSVGFESREKSMQRTLRVKPPPVAGGHVLPWTEGRIPLGAT